MKLAPNWHTRHSKSRAEGRQGIVDRIRGLAVVLAKQMRVDAQRNVRLGMPEPPADRHDINSGADQLQGVGVPERVEREAVEGDGRRDPGPFLAESPRALIPPLSGAGNTRASSGILPMPSAMRSSSCSRRCSRWAATTIAGREMVRRPALFLGGFTWMPPLVSSRASATVMRLYVKRYVLLPAGSPRSTVGASSGPSRIVWLPIFLTTS